MVTKRGKKSTRKVKTLRAKSLTPAQAKVVKGGSGPGDEGPEERKVGKFSVSKLTGLAALNAKIY